MRDLGGSRLGTSTLHLGTVARGCVTYLERLSEDLSWQAMCRSWGSRGWGPAERMVGSTALESKNPGLFLPHIPGCVTLGELRNLSGSAFCISEGR